MEIMKSCNAHLPMFMAIVLVIKTALVTVTHNYFYSQVASHCQYVPVPVKLMCLSVWC